MTTGNMERDRAHEAMMEQCRERVREVKLILQSDADLQHKESAVYRIVYLCRKVGKSCKDVLQEEGVLEGLMKMVCQLELRDSASEKRSGTYHETKRTPTPCAQAFWHLTHLFPRALGETVYDSVTNAEIAANYGLLKIVQASLSKKSEDDVLTEPILTVVNNIIGMQ